MERLISDHNGDLVRYIVRRARSEVDPKEIAQETYIRLFRRERKEVIREPLAYLYRVAANVLSEFQLQQRTQNAWLARWSRDAEEEAEGVSDPQLEMLALSKELQSTLAQLSPKCRAVLILHRQQGLTYEEIGERLGISTGMVKKYLIQGLSHCRKALADWV